ncbi:MAG: DUF4976 domain-containing protein, partial [Verrucomicrobia bacterium]|nr:DUF4976 domain-containing protein [Verrucomicrobiota bacterium]
GHVSPGSECSENVTSTDFYPSLLEAAGLPLQPEQHADGVSLMPLLRGEASLGRVAIYWHYPHYGNQGGAPAASVLAGHWKLIRHFENERLELFNLDDDISESQDLTAQLPDKTAELAECLSTWMKDVEALIPEPNPEWEARLKRPKSPNNAHD